MSANFPIDAAPRPRALAQAPVDALIAGADELARRWAIALIRVRPLERLGEIRLDAFASDGPALCVAAARALESDAELQRIAGFAAQPRGTGEWGAGAREDRAPAVRLVALAGTSDGRTIAEAVEALRGVLWAALLEELGWPALDRSPVRQVAELADRLAHVCSTLLTAALTELPPLGGGQARVAAAPATEAVYETERVLGRGRAVLVDELLDLSPGALAPHGSGAEPAGAPGRHTQGRPLPWDTPLQASDPAQPAQRGQPTISDGPEEMRVTRRSTAPVDERP
jgi:hypothetical protein